VVQLGQQQAIRYIVGDIQTEQQYLVSIDAADGAAESSRS